VVSFLLATSPDRVNLDRDQMRIGNMSMSGGSRDEWTEPGTYEVAQDVYRIPLPLPNDGLKAVNVYAITGENSLTLVDSGWALDEAREVLERALKTLGYELGDVDQFLVTHVHRDHYSQAVALRQVFGTSVSLGAGEQPNMTAMMSPDRLGGLTWQLALLRAHGADEVVDRCVASGLGQGGDRRFIEMPDIWLEDQEQIELPSRTLKVVSTPGHTRGHVVFTDVPHGLLFAGDHVLPHITPSIGVESSQTVLPLGSYLASLELVRSMPDMQLLPAHGPVGPSVHQRVDDLLTHHDKRLASAFDAVSNGAVTAYAVARQLRWTGRASRPLDALDPFNQMLAVLETAAHLDLLVVRHRLTSRSVDGVHHFELPPGGTSLAG